MDESYRALSSAFSLNHTLQTRMDLPLRRETVLDLFERVRKELPRFERFRRYENELALETPLRDGRQDWIALRKSSVRSGSTDPETFADAVRMHRLLLELAPFYLSINPLDVESQELMFAFDLDASGNHNEIVRDALLRDAPIARVVEGESRPLVDVQPAIGVALTDRLDMLAYYEIKTRSSMREIRTGKHRESPISVCLTIRKTGAVRDVKDVASAFDAMLQAGERLVADRVIPHLVQPIRAAIASSNR